MGGTGLVGMLRNGDGPLVLVRADMDGLPSHHSPFFEIDPEPSVTMGVRAMTVAVLELLATD